MLPSFFTPELLRELPRIALRAVRLVSAVAGTASAGGYLCIADNVGHAERITLVGSVDQASWLLCLGTVQMSASGIGPRDEGASMYVYQEENTAYGAAQRFDDYVLAFAGFPDPWNKAVVVAIQYGLYIEAGMSRSVAALKAKYSEDFPLLSILLQVDREMEKAAA